MTKIIRMLLAALAVSFAATPTLAQEAYPSRPVTIINPWPAGTSLDAVVRALADAIQRQSGNAFVIDNVGGAGSVVGTMKASKAKPDGYTLLYGSSSGLVIAPQVNANVKYDALELFEPITLIALAPSFIVVPANSPYHSVRELITAAKAKPDSVTYATNGVGSSFHLTALMMLNATQTEMRHIPFKGAGEALTALIRGDVDWTYQLADVLPLARSGRFRVLAVTHPTRVPSAPEIPTLQEELGMSGLEAAVWVSMLAPKGTSSTQIAIINKMVTSAMKEPSVQSVLEKAGFVGATGTPAELTAFIKREHAKWGKVVRTYNIKVE